MSVAVTQVVLIPPGWTAFIYWVSSTAGGKTAYLGTGSKVTAGNGWPVASGSQYASFGVGRHEPPHQVYGMADNGTITVCVALCHM